MITENNVFNWLVFINDLKLIQDSEQRKKLTKFVKDRKKYVKITGTDMNKLIYKKFC